MIGLKQPTSPERHEDNGHETDSANVELRASQSREKSSAHVTENLPHRYKAVALVFPPDFVQPTIAVLAVVG